MSLEIVTVASDLAPTVAIRVLARAGARVEPRAGVAWLTGKMLGEGTSRWTWDELAELVESKGASLSPFGGLESVGVAVDALAEDWREALDWGLECLLAPSFPPDRFELARLQAGSELQALEDQPELRASYAFRRQLYGPRHARGRPLPGEAAMLSELGVSAAADFHRAALASGLLVVAVGPLSGAELEGRVRDRLALLSVSPPAAAAEVPTPESGPARVEVELPGAEQATLLVGHLSVCRADPDRRALELASVVLGAGSGLSGRIPHRVREQEGLAYLATGSLVSGAGLDPGRVEVTVGTAVEHLDRAEAAVREELERFASDGPTAAEVEEARAFLLGSEALRRETARQLAAIAADGAFYGVPSSLEAARASLLALDHEAVAAAVRRHLHPERLMVTRGVPS